MVTKPKKCLCNCPRKGLSLVFDNMYNYLAYVYCSLLHLYRVQQKAYCQRKGIYFIATPGLVYIGPFLALQSTAFISFTPVASESSVFISRNWVSSQAVMPITVASCSIPNPQMK